MNRKRGYLCILLAAAIFSTTEVVLKGLGGALAPMQITLCRVTIGALFLLPFALRDIRREGRVFTRGDWGYCALLGFLTVTLHMSLLQMAVLHMDASATSIIYSGSPVFTVAAAHLVLREPLRRNHLFALAAELVGILFILNPARLEISLRGFVEILLATVLFALYGTLCKLRMARLGSLAISAFNLVFGALELAAVLLAGRWAPVASLYRALGLSLFADVPILAGIDLKSAALLCYAGIFCAGFGFLLTAKITEYTSATEASFVYLIKPVLATALAAALFHESISVNRLIGLGFFLVASLCVMVPLLLEMKREKQPS